MKLGINPTQNPVSAHLPAFECGTVTTCDDLYDECDYLLTNLVGQNIKKFEKKNCPTLKSVGKVQEGCFWMYSDPLITIPVSICPQKI
jgi:hypothetical protein